MSTTSDMGELKLCPFDPSFNTNSQYVCYKNEICCPNGCCSVYSYKFLQSWYFWLTIAVIFFLYYVISWYCRLLEKKRLRRLMPCNPDQSSSMASSNLNAGVYTNDSGGGDEETVNNLIEQLYSSYRSSNAKCKKNPEPPPMYADALFMPQPQSSKKFQEKLSEDPVPSYEFALATSTSINEQKMNKTKAKKKDDS